MNEFCPDIHGQGIRTIKIHKNHENRYLDPLVPLRVIPDGNRMMDGVVSISETKRELGVRLKYCVNRKVSRRPCKPAGKDCNDFFEIQFIFHYFSVH